MEGGLKKQLGFFTLYKFNILLFKVPEAKPHKNYYRNGQNKYPGKVFTKKLCSYLSKGL